MMAVAASFRTGNPEFRGQGNRRFYQDQGGATARGQEAPYGTNGAARTLYLTSRTVTATTTALVTDHIIYADATAGAITIALPAASTVEGIVYQVKKIDVSANAVTINPDAAETIENAATFALPAQYDALTIHSNGTKWFAI